MFSTMMIGIALAALVVLSTSYVAADVNHNEDLATENCLVCSFVDSFADEITDIIFACSDIEENDFDSSIFRIDYYPRSGIFEISVAYEQGIDTCYRPR